MVSAVDPVTLEPQSNGDLIVTGYAEIERGPNASAADAVALFQMGRALPLLAEHVSGAQLGAVEEMREAGPGRVWLRAVVPPVPQGATVRRIWEALKAGAARIALEVSGALERAAAGLRLTDAFEASIVLAGKALGPADAAAVECAKAINRYAAPLRIEAMRREARLLQREIAFQAARYA